MPFSVVADFLPPPQSLLNGTPVYLHVIARYASCLWRLTRHRLNSLGGWIWKQACRFTCLIFFPLSSQDPYMPLTCLSSNARAEIKETATSPKLISMSLKRPVASHACLPACPPVRAGLYPRVTVTLVFEYWTCKERQLPWCLNYFNFSTLMQTLLLLFNLKFSCFVVHHFCVCT